jgi:hypothetical protein
MVQKSIFVLPQIWADFFAQIAHNLQIIFLIDRSILWQEFMMHHAPTTKENCKQNLTWRAFFGFGSCDSFHWHD